MRNARGPLEISFRGGVGSANYDVYPIVNNDCVPVQAHDACYVCFYPPGVFDNRKHDANDITEWCPKKDDVTVHYRIIDPGGKCPRDNVDRTYSIKVGSGREKKSRRTSRRMSKGKPKRRSKNKH